MYCCQKCDTTAVKKSSILKHVYTHVPCEQWPYKCPVPECRWNGKFMCEYKYHVIGKKHIAKKSIHPDIDDTKPVKNPDRLIVMEEEWLKRETYTQDAPLARLSLPIPEVPRPWVAPPEARMRDRLSTTASSSGASTPLLDERSILSTPKGFNRASLHLTSEEASMSAPQSSGFVSSVPPQVNSSEDSSQHPCPASATGPLTPTVNEEIVTTRKDLTHHFEKLIDHVNICGRDQQTAIDKNTQSLSEIGSRLLSMEEYMKAGLGIQINLIRSTRMKLAGIIDEFLRIVAPLHSHPHDLPVFLPTCSLCVQTEQALMNAIAISSPNLLVMTHRE